MPIERVRLQPSYPHSAVGGIDKKAVNKTQIAAQPVGNKPQVSIANSDHRCPTARSRKLRAEHHCFGRRFRAPHEGHDFVCWIPCNTFDNRCAFALCPRPKIVKSCLLARCQVSYQLIDPRAPLELLEYQVAIGCGIGLQEQKCEQDGYACSYSCFEVISHC